MQHVHVDIECVILSQTKDVLRGLEIIFGRCPYISSKYTDLSRQLIIEHDVCYTEIQPAGQVGAS